jgi:CSLREA domain-containing protein
MRAKALFAAIILGLGSILTLVLLLSLGSLPIANAAHIGPVDTTDDEIILNDNCSLREAIHAANTDSSVDACPTGNGDDTITIPAGTYVLTITGASENSNLTGDLDIIDTDATTITGAGPDLTIIDANTIDRAVHIGTNSGPVVISGVTILNGNAVGWGGGILNYNSNLTLINVVVRDNTADYGGGLNVYQGSTTLIGGQVISNSANFDGGGVYVNDPTAVFTQTGDSTVGYNHANSDGGGVYIYHGSAKMSGGRILGNTSDGDGGGVYVYQARVTLDEVRVLSNTALGNGGGVHVGQLPNTNFTQTGGCIIATNHADGFGGGMYVGQGNATVSGGHYINNTAGSAGGGLYVSFATTILQGGRVVSNTASQGGGIHNSAGTLAVDSAIVSRNAATGTLGGGGIWNSVGVLNLVNTTVSHNTASASYGGGIRVSGGTTILTYTTVASNTAFSGGDGIYRSGGPVSLINTILAYNGSANCNFKPTSNGYNLEDRNTCYLDASGDITNTDPLLGPLIESHGPPTGSGQGTWLHLLLTGSPAIDQGLCLSDPTVDQRGMARPQGNGCDMGAYEAVPDVYLPLILRNS